MLNKIDLNKYPNLQKLFDLNQFKTAINKALESYKTEFSIRILNKDFYHNEEYFYNSTIISASYGSKMYNVLLEMTGNGIIQDNGSYDTLEVEIELTDILIDNLNSELSNLFSDNVFSVCVNQLDGIQIVFYVHEENGQLNLLNHLLQENNCNSYTGEYNRENLLIVEFENNDSHELKDILGIELNNLFLEYGYSDEYCQCSECYSIIRTSPNSAFYVQDYFVGDGYILCKDCIDNDIESIIEHYNDNYNNALTYEMISEKQLNDNGYTKYNQDSFDNGLYSHNKQDSPKKISEELHKEKIYDYVFVINKKTNCYQTCFDVYIKKS